jgi:hypothetical protein
MTRAFRPDESASHLYLRRVKSFVRSSFPYGKHDDQVDSTSQALAWIKAGVCAPGMGLFNFIKEAAEALRPRR